MTQTISESLLDTGMFIQNDYFDSYVDLIVKNAATVKVAHSTQTHHIIPQYYYVNKGLKIDNSESNIVELLYTDHLIAHYYLAMCSINSDDKARNALSIRYILNGKTLDSFSIDEINLDEYQTLYELGREYTFKRSHTPEVNKKVSDKLIGRVSPNKGNITKVKKSRANPNPKNKLLSELAIGRTGENNPFFGHEVSEKTRVAISVANSKPVAMRELNTGDILMVFPSIKVASQYLYDNDIVKSTSISNRISRVCRANNAHFCAYGYNWSFVEKDVTTIESVPQKDILWE